MMKRIIDYGDVSHFVSQNHRRSLGKFLPTNTEKAIGLLYAYAANLKDRKWKKRNSST